MEAFAYSIGSEGNSTHQHTIQWTFNPINPKKGSFALFEIEFLCGCKLNNQNIRAIDNNLLDRFSWNLILNCDNNSQPLSNRTIRIEKKYIKE